MAVVLPVTVTCAGMSIRKLSPLRNCPISQYFPAGTCMVTRPCRKAGTPPMVFSFHFMLVAENTCTDPSRLAGAPARSKPLIVSVYFGIFGWAGADSGPKPLCAAP